MELPAVPPELGFRFKMRNGKETGILTHRWRDEYGMTWHSSGYYWTSRRPHEYDLVERLCSAPVENLIKRLKEIRRDRP